MRFKRFTADSTCRSQPLASAPPVSIGSSDRFVETPSSFQVEIKPQGACPTSCNLPQVCTPSRIIRAIDRSDLCRVLQTRQPCIFGRSSCSSRCVHFAPCSCSTAAAAAAALAHDHVRSCHFTFPSLGFFKTFGSNCVVTHCTFHSFPAFAIVRDSSVILCGDSKTTLTSRHLLLLEALVAETTPGSNGVLGTLTLIVGSRRMRSHGSPVTLKRSSISQALSSGSKLDRPCHLHTV